jgi:hypothetical protein
MPAQRRFGKCNGAFLAGCDEGAQALRSGGLQIAIVDCHATDGALKCAATESKRGPERFSANYPGVFL